MSIAGGWSPRWQAALCSASFLELAQAGALISGDLSRRPAEQLKRMEADAVLPAAERDSLHEAQRLFWGMRVAARLVFGEGFPDTIGVGAAHFLTRVAAFDSLDAAERAVSEARMSVAEIVSRAFDA